MIATKIPRNSPRNRALNPSLSGISIFQTVKEIHLILLVCVLVFVCVRTLVYSCTRTDSHKVEYLCKYMFMKYLAFVCVCMLA